ncbi:MAG: hypothetical protein IIY62_06690, partial [Kiritimatiellae bacterium]|nr:hypothetical protein [Kiritimatiellia bacterium]
VSACMAGAVCGDHCSPISDTTIMASAGAQCNHIVHVNTQLPYALAVAAVSFVAYVVAPFVGSAWIALPLAVLLMLAALFFLRLILKGPVSEGARSAVLRKFAQSVNNRAFAAELAHMADAILADGRIDEREAAQLADLLDRIEGQEEFRKALDDARTDGVITLEESANIEAFIRRLTGRKA